jgi:hypothetical protein
MEYTICFNPTIRNQDIIGRRAHFIHHTIVDYAPFIQFGPTIAQVVKFSDLVASNFKRTLLLEMIVHSLIFLFHNYSNVRARKLYNILVLASSLPRRNSEWDGINQVLGIFNLNSFF